MKVAVVILAISNVLLWAAMIFNFALWAEVLNAIDAYLFSRGIAP